jgi:Leucine-rich repeat (LRR) protein
VLPASLQILSVHRNALASLPATLPIGLHTLVASHNKIAALPSVLPPALRHLRLDHNTLSVFPTNLNDGLIELWLEHNAIPYIERVTVPISLLSLRLDHNRITHIHHFSFNPALCCTLEGNRLPLPYEPDKELLYDYLVRLIQYQDEQMRSWY